MSHGGEGHACPLSDQSDQERLIQDVMVWTQAADSQVKGIQGGGDSFSRVALTFPMPWTQQAEQPGSVSRAPGSVPLSSPHLSPKAAAIAAAANDLLVEPLPSPGLSGFQGSSNHSSPQTAHSEPLQPSS